MGYIELEKEKEQYEQTGNQWIYWKMEEVGDVWTEEQVNDVYGDSSFEDALADRQSSLGYMSDIISKVINK